MMRSASLLLPLLGLALVLFSGLALALPSLDDYNDAVTKPARGIGDCGPKRSWTHGLGAQNGYAQLNWQDCGRTRQFQVAGIVAQTFANVSLPDGQVYPAPGGLFQEADTSIRVIRDLIAAIGGDICTDVDEWTAYVVVLAGENRDTVIYTYLGAVRTFFNTQCDPTTVAYPTRAVIRVSELVNPSAHYETKSSGSYSLRDRASA